jgi:hypothetical protein
MIILIRFFIILLYIVFKKNENKATDNVMPIIEHRKQETPLLPRSEPPPLPKSEPPAMLSKINEQVANNLGELNINKAILDEIKVIDNWKHEQEILMRVCLMKI